jgi:hypothetical protein
MDREEPLKKEVRSEKDWEKMEVRSLEVRS